MKANVTVPLTGIDALPMGRAQWKAIVLVGLVFAGAGLDMEIIQFVLAALVKDRNITPAQVGIVGGAAQLGMLAGSILAGRLSDRFGRKVVLVIFVLTFGLFSGLGALARDYLALSALRFMVGVGVGGCQPAGTTLISELSPPKYRGGLVTLIQVFYAVGTSVTAALSLLVIPQFGIGLAFMLAAVPVLLVPLLWMYLSESTRFLVQRTQERPRGEGSKPTHWSALGNRGPVASRFSVSGILDGLGVRELWTPQLRVNTICAWILWFGMIYVYYGVYTWLPSLLVSTGHSLSEAIRYVFYITLAGIAGCAVSALLVDRIGRRATILGSMLLGAFAITWLGQASATWSILVAGGATAFFLLSAWSTMTVFTSEVYPTRLRGTGTGWASSFGRIGGITAPLTIGLILGSWGRSYSDIFLMFGVVLVLMVIAIGLLASETKARGLEEIAM